MIKVCEKALECLRAHFGEVQLSILMANAYNMLGTAYAMINQYRAAVDYYDRALYVRNELQMSNNYGTAEILINRASMLKKLEDYDKCLEFEHKALDIARKFFDEKSPRLLVIFQSLASTYSKL
jgi:tetratricopeptide (TPR) repeat protein